MRAPFLKNSDFLDRAYIEFDGVKKLLEDFKYGDELGSIIQLRITASELNELKKETDSILDSYYNNIFDTMRQGMIRTDFVHVIKQAEILIGKYFCSGEYRLLGRWLRW